MHGTGDKLRVYASLSQPQWRQPVILPFAPLRGANAELPDCVRLKIEKE